MEDEDNDNSNGESINDRLEAAVLLLNDNMLKFNTDFLTRIENLENTILLMHTEKYQNHEPEKKIYQLKRMLGLNERELKGKLAEIKDILGGN